METWGDVTGERVLVQMREKKIKKFPAGAFFHTQFECLNTVRLEFYLIYSLHIIHSAFTRNMLFETSRDSRRKTCLHELDLLDNRANSVPEQTQGHLKPW